MDYLITLAPSIIAALTLLFAYLQNRDNNKSHMKKFAYEKRVEALRELYEYVSDFSSVSMALLQIRDEQPNSDNIMPVYRAWSERYDKLDAVYRKNAAFIPDSVDAIYRNRKKAKVYTSPNPPTEEILNQIESYDEAILKEIKKYINR